MTSQPGKKQLPYTYCSNISRSKGNQAMKFDQLIKYNMRNIFLEKHIQDVAKKLFRDPDFLIKLF